jgi:hypothetical protein
MIQDDPTNLRWTLENQIDATRKRDIVREKIPFFLSSSSSYHTQELRQLLVAIEKVEREEEEEQVNLNPLPSRTWFY